MITDDKRKESFQKHNIELYEKYIDIIKNNKIYKICDFIEILLRIKTNTSDNIYHYNYDNYEIYK